MKYGNFFTKAVIDSPRIGNRITFRYGDGTVANGGAADTGGQFLPRCWAFFCGRKLTIALM